jgi:hypothetical protein
MSHLSLRIFMAVSVLAFGLSVPKTAIGAPEHDRKQPGQEAKPVAEQITEALAVLRKTDIKDSQRWAKAARDLVQIGKPAVPPLVEELDRTTENPSLRSLGFTLRSIGDPRAVPALIRAIPRTLVPAGSDYGLTMDDPELLAFLQKHDLDEKEGGRLFTFGMPYREITGALHTLTGQRFNLRGIEYTAPGSDRCYYAIQGLGLRAWQVDNRHYGTIENDIRDNKLPPLDRPATLLMDFDPKTKSYHAEKSARTCMAERAGRAGAAPPTASRWARGRGRPKL